MLHLEFAALPELHFPNYHAECPMLIEGATLHLFLLPVERSHRSTVSDNRQWWACELWASRRTAGSGVPGSRRDL